MGCFLRSTGVATRRRPWLATALTLCVTVVGVFVVVSPGPAAEAQGPASPVVSAFDVGIAHPDGIVTGPDGALWFTNYGPGPGAGTGDNSIGRISTGGEVTGYTGPGINQPAHRRDQVDR